MVIATGENESPGALQRITHALQAAGLSTEVAFLDALVRKAEEIDCLKQEVAAERQDWTALVELLAARVEQVEKGSGGQQAMRSPPELSVSGPSYERLKFVPYGSVTPFSPSHDPLVIDFSDVVLPPFVQEVIGMSHPESWGRWTDSEICRIVLAKPISGRYQVLLECYASEPNEDRFILFVLGGNTLVFRPSAVSTTYEFTIDTLFFSRTVEFMIPNAISPSTIHEGRVAEPRRLGLALRRLEISRVV